MNILTDKLNKNLFFLINIKIFPFFYTVILTLVLMEAVTYPGFIKKNLLFELNTYFFIFIVNALITKYVVTSKIFEDLDILLIRLVEDFNKLLIPAVLVLEFIFMRLDTLKYENYVYATLHINPTSLLLLLKLILAVFLLQPASSKKIFGIRIFKFTEKKRKQGKVYLATTKELEKIKGPDILIVNKDILRLLILITIIWVLIENLFNSSNTILNQSKQIIRRPLASYDQKMKAAWGPFYDYMKLIKDNTEETSYIYNPPQRIRVLDGNQFLIRPFLFPRVLISGQRVSWDVASSSAKYIMITDTWPEFELPFKKFIFLPQKISISWHDFIIKFKNSTETIDSISELDNNSARSIESIQNDQKILRLVYTTSGYDYWGKSVNKSEIPSSVSASVNVYKSGWVSLIAGIKLNNGTIVVLSSPSNKMSASDETLVIDDLSERLSRLASLNGWQLNNSKLEFIGFNTNSPYTRSKDMGNGIMEFIKNEKEVIGPLKYYNDYYLINQYRFYNINGELNKMTDLTNEIDLLHPDFVLVENKFSEVEKQIRGRK